MIESLSYWNQSINCYENQPTGFYMIRTYAMKKFKAFWLQIHDEYFSKLNFIFIITLCLFPWLCCFDLYSSNISESSKLSKNLHRIRPPKNLFLKFFDGFSSDVSVWCLSLRPDSTFCMWCLSLRPDSTFFMWCLSLRSDSTFFMWCLSLRPDSTFCKKNSTYGRNRCFVASWKL